jgi:ribosome-binding ATPase
VDAIVQVVRCFEDADIHHVTGSLTRARHRNHHHRTRARRSGSRPKNAGKSVPRTPSAATRKPLAEEKVLAKFEPHLDAGKPALTVELTPEEKVIAPVFSAHRQADDFCLQREGIDLATADQNPFVLKVREYVKTHLACEAVVISAQIESDLIDLSDDRGEGISQGTRREESGVGALIRATYHLLGLRTYFTAGEKEVRAWTIHVGDTAPKAAGVIHSDFERGFIKAETVAYDDLVKCGSVAAAREKGLYRMEGKEYVVKGRRRAAVQV